MRTMQVTALNQPLTLQELDTPTPGPGEVLVRIDTCGMNFGDTLMIKGTYQATPPVPFTLGMEVAGVVGALGPDTDGPAVGSDVLVFGGRIEHQGWTNADAIAG